MRLTVAILLLSAVTLLGQPAFSVGDPSFRRLDLGGAAGPDTTPPELLTATVLADGLTLELVFNEAVTIGAGEFSGLSMVWTGAGITDFITPTGEGTDTLLLSEETPVLAGDTVDTAPDYNQPGDGIEDLAGNDLASIFGITVVNNSEQNPVTYLLEENFEATGYDETGWTNIGVGTIDPDDATSPAPLVGTESVRFVTSSSVASIAGSTFTPLAEGWGYLQIHWVTTQVGNRVFIRLRGGTIALCEIRRNSDGTVRITQGAATATTVGTLDEDTTYHVWWYYNDDSGPDDGIARVAFSTDGTKPTSGDNFAEATGGTQTVDVDNIEIGNITSGIEDKIMDKVRTDDEDIGSNPQ